MNWSGLRDFGFSTDAPHVSCKCSVPCSSVLATKRQVLPHFISFKYTCLSTTFRQVFFLCATTYIILPTSSLCYALPLYLMIERRVLFRVQKKFVLSKYTVSVLVYRGRSGFPNLCYVIYCILNFMFYWCMVCLSGLCFFFKLFPSHAYFAFIFI